MDARVRDIIAERSMELPVYSTELIAMARVLDHAYLEVFAALWHYSDLICDTEEEAYNSAALEWTRERTVRLCDSLPALDTAFFERLKAESKPLEVSAQYVDTDDGRPRRMTYAQPKEVAAIIQPILDEPKFLHPYGTGNKEALDAQQFAEYSKTFTVVNFEEDLYLFPKGFNTTLIEIWFPRMFTYSFGGPYSIGLVTKPYGYDAHGFER